MIHIITYNYNYLPCIPTMRDTAVTGWRIPLDEFTGAVQSTKVLGLEEPELQELREQLEQQDQDGGPDILQA